MSWFSRIRQRVAQWIQPSPQPVEEEAGDFNLFQLSERAIYRFFDGQKVIDADPMRLYRKVAEVGPDLWVDAKLAYSPSRKAFEGYDAMLKKIRKIFDVKPLEEGGLTDPEAEALFNHFMGYVDSVKKNSLPPLTPAEATSPSTPSPSAPTSGESAAASPATSNSSDSGSTKSDPSTNTPTPSRSEVPLPWASSSPETSSTAPTQTEPPKPQP